MNSESISSDSRLHLTREESSVDASAVLSSRPPASHPVPVSPVDKEGDDLAFAKARTLMMDQEPEGEDSQSLRSPSEGLKCYYVQGVVRNQQAHIVTNLPGGESQVLVQPQMVWTIGRNREAALPLRDRVLSRRHAVILYVQNEGFYLIDLNSMNGSYVNGVRIHQRQLLNDGDRIRLGSIEFSFFVSARDRVIDPIHPEVLARFTNTAPRAGDFVGFSALEEPEIFFRTVSKR